MTTGDTLQRERRHVGGRVYEPARPWQAEKCGELTGIPRNFCSAAKFAANYCR